MPIRAILRLKEGDRGAITAVFDLPKRISSRTDTFIRFGPILAGLDFLFSRPAAASPVHVGGCYFDRGCNTLSRRTRNTS